ncbi:MAG: response regulator [Patescibacteria group bacterium]
MKNKKTILVIEDEKPLLEAVKMKLEKNNFDVITSRSVIRAFGSPLEEDGKGTVTKDSIIEALKHIENLERVDAIWLDHNLLGKEDGLDFVTKFKANDGKWSKIPIFVVSNTSNSDLVKTYAKLGVNHYYIKAEHKLENIIKEINLCLEPKK